MPRQVAPVTPITLDRRQFHNMVRTHPFGTNYKQKVGLALYATALDNAFTESLRSMTSAGFWAYGTSTGPHGHTALRFSDKTSLDTFFNTAIRSLFEFDLRKIQNRQEYIAGLKGKAAATLYTELTNSAEPEGNYYSPKRAQQVGAPLVPAETGKGLAWLTWGVQGDTSAFTKALFKLTKRDGSFPLGTNRNALFEVFPSLVPLAPAYRGWNNAASMQKYPSNVGGMKLLDEVITDLAIMTMPPPGDTRWYGLGLYVFGSIMTSQAFTDGNKRMSRFAYILMLLSGGVPIVVPNAVMGSSLGDMM